MANNSSAVAIISQKGNFSHQAYPYLLVLWLLLLLLLYACKPAPTLPKKSFKPQSPPLKDIFVPKWYANLPQLPGCQLAYAHSGIYIDADRQKDALLENGAANLAKNKSVKLEVGWAASQKTSHSQIASYIKEEEWQHRAESLEKDVEILSQFRLDRSILAIVGVCPGQTDIESLSAMLDNSMVKVSSKRPPAWVRTPLQVSGQLFGVGTAAGRTTAAKAWQEAERQARADLAIRLAANYKNLERNLSQNTYTDAHNISETQAKLTLNNLKVIRHAYSHIGQTFYALVSIPSAAP